MLIKGHRIQCKHGLIKRTHLYQNIVHIYLPAASSFVPGMNRLLCHKLFTEQELRQLGECNLLRWYAYEDSGYKYPFVHIQTHFCVRCLILS